MKAFTVETLYSTIYHSKYFIELNIDKFTQYVALSGELWSVFYEYFNRNWSCYKGFLLYKQWCNDNSLVVKLVGKYVISYFVLSSKGT